MNQGETPEINTNETQDTTQEASLPTLIEVTASDDCMTGYIKLVKQSDNPLPVTKEQLMKALTDNRITYGIRETSVEKLAARPIYNIKIEVAKGEPSENGEDGYVTFYVKRDSEYRPEVSMDGIIDYKNLEYFQMVKKDSVLAEVTRETAGREGTNVYGAKVPARDGKTPNTPVGKNTHLTQDDTLLVAECDGVIRFMRDTIDVNDMLKINSSIDQLTGNIRFTGDVSIEGDVSSGFSVKSGGNVIVRGVVEDAEIEAAGNVHIAKGINGGGKNTIYVGGNLKCKYIEHANIHVEGNINADYIIDSNVTCMGNIELSGSKEIVVGGEIKVLGELRAKDIGSESERTTRVEVLGIKIMDTEAIEKATKERDELNARLQLLVENAAKLNQARMTASGDFLEQMGIMKKQILVMREKVEELSLKVQQLEKDWTMEYNGAVVCKRKLYQGVKISFGENRFHFELSNLDHCRIFWDGHEIIQGTL